ncbi:Fe-S cluster assembly iron-binding protein IscA [Flavobacterium sp. CG_23.5]|uniref:PKD domain-containing protein n=1 Tax=unclassified Flavobacterium TaxID=196869 RepID=UPI0018CA2F7B|nr:MULTISPECIES: hypothetical protein [unclassified Flavobacterium]MBG6110529.1 Fe-S cluster assembly iron-binding protein IscA [Flavobacterium sp. CG_9.10]MBP2284041.1 Fe-S cluster assembly iron-binding protein IscA [Flavobacterium sp. CG_23.5]
MKRSIYYRLLVCVVVLFISNSCSNDAPLENSRITSTPIPVPSPSPSSPPTPTTQNATLTVTAGEDVQAILSSSYRQLILSGYFFVRGTHSEIINMDNAKIQWSKKTGPTSYTIENPNSIKTKVSNLEKGVYEFELTVSYDNGLIAKDIVRFTIESISNNSNEIIFQNKVWLPIWYSNIEINDFNLLISQNNFKVYIQRENNPQWIEVKHY